VITEKHTVPMSQLYLDDTAETPLNIVREIIRAPAQTVWEAWTTPEFMKHWWGAETYRFVFVLRDAPHVLVCKRCSSHRQGQVSDTADVFDGPFALVGESYVTVELTELKHQTCLTLWHARLPASTMDECVRGWKGTLQKLKALVGRQ
jgi:uncharacterized protein YndB with AHSA1/START domain